MSKLIVAVLAFSSVSLAVGHEDLSLGVFVNNPKIKRLSDPAVKNAYPGDEIDYDGLLKAVAALQLEKQYGYRAVEQVKEVLKEHDPTLYQRVENAREAFAKVVYSFPASKATDFLNQYLGDIEEYYLVGLSIAEQARETEDLIERANRLSDEEKKVVAEKLKEAFDAVVKALYDPSVSLPPVTTLRPAIDQDLSLGVFVSNPKIKLLSNPAVKDAYPGDDTDYDALLKALAAIQEDPVRVETVKLVLRLFAPKLGKRVQNGEDAFRKIAYSIPDPKSIDFLNEYLEAIEKYYLVGLSITEQAKETEHLVELANGFSDEDKKVVAEKLHEAFDAVVKALYDPSV
ncbi:hypothetical protein AAVH_27677 [Aphelenchoides avenae]|nr:hypothetical protein AAVH_27677 [Aphelenchus avenae]